MDLIDSVLNRIEKKNQSQDELLVPKELLNEHTNDKENPHGVTKSQIDLNNVDNTSDADKPVSIAQQEAIAEAYEQAKSYADLQISKITLPEILNTSEKLNSNATEGKLVDALVIKEVFQSVSDGKQLVASAITDKGIETEATDTFKTMAENINLIRNNGDVNRNETYSVKHLVNFSMAAKELSPLIMSLDALNIMISPTVHAATKLDLSFKEG